MCSADEDVALVKPVCLGILQTFVLIPESGCKQHRTVPVPGSAGESCKAAVELLGVDSVLPGSGQGHWLIFR